MDCDALRLLNKLFCEYQEKGEILQEVHYYARNDESPGAHFMANVWIEALKERIFKADKEMKTAYERDTGHSVDAMYVDYLTGDKAERAEIGGQLFEYLLYKQLYKMPGVRRFICNPYLPTKYGTTEIDVILISTSGIFVFECKNYSGSIYAKKDARQWLYYLGKQKHSFYSPVLQNKGHIRALMEMLDLPEEMFLSLIAFAGENTLKVEYDRTRTLVAHTADILYAVKNRIKKGEQLLTEEQVVEIYEKLLPYCKVDETVKEEHVQQVKEQQLICPRCGGKLVERKGKTGAFYGCSNYPKCRYTRNLNQEQH